MFFQIILNFLSVYSKKRTDPIYPFTGRIPESPWIPVPLARFKASFPHYHSDDAQARSWSPITDPYLLKRLSSHQTPCLLHRHLFFAQRFLLHSHDTQYREHSASAKCFRKPFVSFAVSSTKSVIHMHCDHIKSDFFLQSQSTKSRHIESAPPDIPARLYLLFAAYDIFQ